MASAPFLPVTTASVSWYDNDGVHIHVFASDGYTISERVIGNGQPGWSNGTLPTTTAGNNVSAAAWTDTNGAHIRLYCTSDDGITEWCLDGEGSQWYQGQYTLS